MRKLIEQHVGGDPIYVFTTLGHVQVGTVDSLDAEVVFMRAPDGRTPLHINLSDISGVRPYVEEPEEWP